MRKTIYRNTGSDIFFDLFVKISLALLVVVEIFPLVYTVSASISDPLKVINGEMWLFPKGFTLDSYKLLMARLDVWKGFRNSTLYTVLCIIISLSLTLLAAFPLSRRDLKGRGTIMKILIFTMYFHGGMIPTYLIVKQLGMVNSMWSVILLGSLSTYNIIVTRSFLENTIPTELYEAAFMDGCSNWKMLFKIVIPLSKPIMAVMVMFYGVAQWNEFFNSLLYLTKSDLQPLQLVLRKILFTVQASSGSDDEGAMQRLLTGEQLKYSTIIVTSIPMFLLYPFAQKYFVQGVMIGAVKG